MPAACLPFLTRGVQVGRRLLVLTAPNVSGASGSDRVSCQGPRVNRVVDGGGVVAQSEGVLGRVPALLSFGQEGQGVSRTSWPRLGLGGWGILSRPVRGRQLGPDEDDALDGDVHPQRGCPPAQQARELVDRGLDQVA